MTKRLIDIDDELLAEVKRVLNASTMKETVNKALQETLDLYRRRQHRQHLATMEGLDLENPEIVRGSWQRDF